MDLDLFHRLVLHLSAQWTNDGIRWEFHRGPARDKSAAWVDCESESGGAQLIVWTSGEAELSAISLGSGDTSQEHYDLSSELGLIGALDDLEAHVRRT